MIAIVGLGFVGLTTGLGFCEKGLTVYGVERDEAKRAQLSEGNVPFFEPGVADALKKHLNTKFFVKADITEAMQDADTVFFCVGTPSSPEGAADLLHLNSAVKEALNALTEEDRKVFVIKSTVPPSTAKNEIQPLITKSGKNVLLANNPEFLREGKAWEDFLNPDRIVVGTENTAASAKLAEIYQGFNAEVISTTLNTAEFIKYLSNTLLATMISFSNDMASVADAVGGIDIRQAFEVLHKDRRWNGSPAPMSTYVYPGCGYGGSCLPKDTRAMNHLSEAVEAPSGILKAALAANDRRKAFVVDAVKHALPNKGVVAVLGLAFKPDTDDVRESPALGIINALIEEGYENIIAYDPMANSTFAKACKHDIIYADEMKTAVEKADVSLLLTSWKEFKDNASYLLNKKILDFRYYL